MTVQGRGLRRYNAGRNDPGKYNPRKYYAGYRYRGHDSRLTSVHKHRNLHDWNFDHRSNRGRVHGSVQ